MAHVQVTTVSHDIIQFTWAVTMHPSARMYSQHKQIQELNWKLASSWCQTNHCPVQIRWYLHDMNCMFILVQAYIYIYTHTHLDAYYLDSCSTLHRCTILSLLLTSLLSPDHVEINCAFWMTKQWVPKRPIQRRKTVWTMAVPSHLTVILCVALVGPLAVVVLALTVVLCALLCRRAWVVL